MPGAKMKIKVEERERIIIYVLILSLISIGIYRFIFIPKIRNIGSVKKDIEVLSLKIRDVEALEKEIPLLREDLAASQKEFSVFEEGLIEKGAISQAISRLSLAGEKHGLKFTSIKRLDNRESEVIAICPGLLCSRFLIVMDIRGRYNDIGRYVEEIMRLPLIARVERIEILSKGDILPEVNALLTLALYMRE